MLLLRGKNISKPLSLSFNLFITILLLALPFSRSLSRSLFLNPSVSLPVALSVRCVLVLSAATDGRVCVWDWTSVLALDQGQSWEGESHSTMRLSWDECQQQPFTLPRSMFMSVCMCVSHRSLRALPRSPHSPEWSKQFVCVGRATGGTTGVSSPLSGQWWR